MIPSGSAGAISPVRPLTETFGSQGQGAQQSTVARASGDEAPAIRRETVVAVDPARQSAAAANLPREESNERARARALVEPSRLAPQFLTGEAPRADTLAGPPPTFDISVLEKARELARTPAAVTGPEVVSTPAAKAPEPPPAPIEAADTSDEVETRRQEPAREPREPVVRADVGPARAEPARTEPSRAEPSRAEPSRADAARVEAARVEAARGEAARGEAVAARPDPTPRGAPPRAEVPGETA